MKILNGVHTSATIFTVGNPTHAIDHYALEQLQQLCNNETLQDARIRVMPDVHPGIVGTIGLTLTLTDKIMPNLLGIDIGCGMTLAKIKDKKVEFQKLDTVIRNNIPSGFAIRKKAHRFSENFPFEKLYCLEHINLKKAQLSLGTLGEGNHFLEMDKDLDGQLYIVIHSGSRHLGKEVTEYYLNQGQQVLKQQGIQIPYELTYLEGAWMEKYLHDIQIVQDYASLNREIILDELAKGMKWKITDQYECIHNYVDDCEDVVNMFGAPLLRKGAISAKQGESVIIPINMRDGILLGTGLGNEEWNFSAPHGAGRILKREEVKNKFTVSAFKSEMKGIYTTCIGKDTLDEAPFAYRGLDDIAEAIHETVHIDQIIRPIYNFKAGENEKR